MVPGVPVRGRAARTRLMALQAILSMVITGTNGREEDRMVEDEVFATSASSSHVPTQGAQDGRTRLVGPFVAAFAARFSHLV